MTQRTGKRAVLVAANQPLEIWERPVADPGPGEVLAHLTHGGVCGTDVHFWRGEVPLPGPVVLGHEGVAVIEMLGAGVATDYAGTPVAVGDRV
jgi:5-exo-hydroxycamphor dehydrogenase